MILLMIKRGLMFGSALSLFVALMLRRIPQVSQDVRAGDDPLILYVMLVFTIQLSFLLLAERLLYNKSSGNHSTDGASSSSSSTVASESARDGDASHSSEIRKKRKDSNDTLNLKDLFVAVVLGAIAIAIGFDYIRKYNPELLYGFSNRSGGNAMVAAIIDIMAIEFKSKWFHEITQIGFYLVFALAVSLVFVVIPLIVIKRILVGILFLFSLFIPFNGLFNFVDEVDVKEKDKEKKKGYIISTMEKIHNFRDAANLNQTLHLEKGRKIKRGKLFRGASPHVASPSDLAKLKEYKIKFIVDLRQPDEREPDDVLEYHKEFKRIHDRMKDEELIEIALKKHPVRVGWNLANSKAGRHIVMAAGLQRVLLYLFFPRFSDKFYLQVVQHLPSPIRNLLEHSLTTPFSIGVPARVLGMHLSATYYAFAKYNGEDIRSILNIATHLFENDSAMLIHCVSGKDRTGTIVGLILLAAGVPVEYVREEYHISHEFGLSPYHFREVLKKPVPSSLWMQEKEVTTLFGAKKEVFDEFIGFLLDDFGTIENYFDSIGFDGTMRQRLRNALLESN